MFMTEQRRVPESFIGAVNPSKIPIDGGGLGSPVPSPVPVGVHNSETRMLARSTMTCWA
jgi:hypothetical protein